MRNRYDRTDVADETVEPRPVWRTPRSRGMLTGLALVLLGAWGALIPFIGPYFDFGYPPDRAWAWTSVRGWLEVLPGAVAFVAGLMLLTATHRAAGQLAGWLGVAAGAWFVVGPVLWPLWDDTGVGTPMGGQNRQVLTTLVVFFGLGAAIILFSALAVGRFSISGARDVLLTRRVAADRADTVTPEDAAYAGPSDLDRDGRDDRDAVATTAAAPAAGPVQGTAAPNQPQTQPQTQGQVPGAMPPAAAPGYGQPGYGQPGYTGQQPDYAAPAYGESGTDTGYNPVGSPARPDSDRDGVPDNRESHGKHGWSPLRRFQHH